MTSHEYIEREALKQKIAEVQDESGDPISGSQYEIGYHNGLTMAYTLAITAPAADVAPVVHAEWVVCGDGEDVPWVCSHCGKTTAHKYKTMYGKYCPSCGAKMDGE